MISIENFTDPTAFSTDFLHGYTTITSCGSPLIKDIPLIRDTRVLVKNNNING